METRAPLSAAPIAPDSYQTYAEGCFDQFSIHAMCQDSRGFLWFCTQDGLVRFDGAKFVTHRVDDGVLYSHVTSIVPQPDQPTTFWLGTAGAGLLRFQPEFPGACELLTTAKHGLASDDVHAVAFAPSGSLWVATSQGLSLCTIQPFSATTIVAGHTTCVLAYNEGVICGLASGEVVFLSPSGEERLRITDLNKGSIKCLLRDSNGALWIGTERGGVVRIDDKGERAAFGSRDGLAHDHIAAMHCDSDGELWFCSWGGGVSRAKQRQFGRRLVFTTVSTKEGLAANAIQSIFEDREQRIWFGSVGAGATCLTPGKTRRTKFFQTFSTNEGLGNNMVACMAQDAKDRLWFGCFSGGVTVYDPMNPRQAWRVFTSKEGLGHDTVRCIQSDARGRMWLATPGAGLSCLDGERISHFQKKDGLASDIARWIVASKDGTFWVATDGGATQFDPLAPGSCRSMTMADGLLSNSLMHLYEDTDDGRDHLWFVYQSNGATRWDRKTNEMTHFTPPNPHLIMMCKDAAGHFWFATNGSGVLRFDGEVFRSLSVEQGLPHEVVYSVVTSKGAMGDEQVWGSTVKGVFRIIGAPHEERIMSFDKSDGLGGDECNGRSVLRDKTGRLWFGNTGGASWIAPNTVPSDAQPCGTYVTAMRARAPEEKLRRISVSEPGAIKAYEFLFDYTAVEFTSPHKTEYRFRLEGLESEWVRRTTERAIRYTNLQPGEYVLLVEARNWTGQWSAPARLAFTVI